GGDDLGLLVGNDAHFLQLDADDGEVVGDVTDVLVLGAPGQDLVADHEQRGGDDLVAPRLAVIAHRYSLAGRPPMSSAAASCSRPETCQSVLSMTQHSPLRPERQGP